MTRLNHFRDRVANHLIYRRLARKITEAEFDQCVAFIEDHDHLGHLDYEYAVNRMHLDRPKPKNWAIIQDLCLMANSVKMEDS